MPRQLLLIFDYDHSLINDNSDTYVPLKLEAKNAVELLNAWVGEDREGDARVAHVRGWNELMNLVVRTSQLEDGRTIQDVREAAASVPFDPHMLEIVRRAHASSDPGSKIVILSDANDLYIDSFLQHHGLEKTIHAVFSNPTHLDRDGVLGVGPYHSHSHGCGLCPPNLCKGKVYVNEIFSSFCCDENGEKDGKDVVVVYVGDGSGDFCPSTKLRAGDLVFCRNDPRQPRARGLIRKINESPPGTIKAEVVEWTSGLQILERLVKEGLLR